MKKRVAGYLGSIFRGDAKYGRFLLTLLLSGIAYGLYRGVQDNYLAEIVHISKFERGIVEFFRELPGLLVVLTLAAMYHLTESKIFKIGTAFMLAGVAGLMMFGNGKFIVVVFMMVFSFGEHIIMPVKSTLTMDLAKPEKGGVALGVSGSLNQIGNIAGFVVVTGLFAVFSRLGFAQGGVAPFKAVYAISVALMVGAVLVSLALQESNIKPERKRFYFAKKFSKFYMLEIFYGSRKQVFLTFAPYVLI
ncbi:MAG: hypothetical protein LBT31_08935, partial [Synergistaceae bacterium]|nr:hypothetical protein [Synergistaceae bacterium]